MPVEGFKKAKKVVEFSQEIIHHIESRRRAEVLLYLHS